MIRCDKWIMRKQFKYLGFYDMGKTTQTSKSNGLYTLLTTGQTVWLDKDLANSSRVEVVSQTPKRMFTTVTSNGELDTWEVMTYRLTAL